MNEDFDMTNPRRPTIDAAHGAALWYGIDFADWLAGGTVESVSASAEAPLVILEAAQISGSIVKAKIQIPNDLLHRTLRLSFTINTIDEDADTRSIFLRAVQR